MANLELNTTRNRQATQLRYTNGIAKLETRHTSHDGKTSTVLAQNTASTGSYYPQANTDDVVVDNYMQRRNSGEIIMNDYKSVKTTQVGFNTRWSFRTVGAINYGWSVYTYTFNCDLDPWQSGLTSQHFDVASLVTPSISSDYDLASARLYSKMDEASMLALTTAWEFRKSVATINHSYRECWKMLRYLLKTKRLLAAGLVTASHAAQVYLEVRYGLRPIFYDVRNAIDAITSLGSSKRTRVYTELPESSSSATYQNINCVGGNLNLKLDREVTDRWSCSAGAIIEPKLGTIDVNDAFGTNDIVESVWEVIPFSFIVDWFINVGTWLSAVAPNYETTVCGTWFKAEREQTVKVTPVAMWWQDVNHALNVNGSSMLQAHPVRLEVKTTERYVNRGKPSLPRLNIRLDGLKILDILAIIKERFNPRWRF